MIGYVFKIRPAKLKLLLNFYSRFNVNQRSRKNFGLFLRIFGLNGMIKERNAVLHQYYR